MGSLLRNAEVAAPLLKSISKDVVRQTLSSPSAFAKNILLKGAPAGLAGGAIASAFNDDGIVHNMERGLNTTVGANLGGLGGLAGGVALANKIHNPKGKLAAMLASGFGGTVLGGALGLKGTTLSKSNATGKRRLPFFMND